MNAATKKAALKGLRRALKLVKAGWTRGYFARDKWGHAVDDGSKKACRFCALGAMYRAFPTCGPGWDVAYSALHEASPTRNVVLFNDDASTKKQHVVCWFERAIHNLKGG
jgi:hypothetical protein